MYLHDAHSDTSTFTFIFTLPSYSGGISFLCRQSRPRLFMLSKFYLSPSKAPSDCLVTAYSRLTVLPRSYHYFFSLLPLLNLVQRCQISQQLTWELLYDTRKVVKRKCEQICFILFSGIIYVSRKKTSLLHNFIFFCSNNTFS
jgi:hypothetical protein